MEKTAQGTPLDRAQAIIARHGLKWYFVAAAVGVSPDTLRGWLRGDARYADVSSTPERRKRLAAALGEDVFASMPAATSVVDDDGEEE